MWKRGWEKVSRRHISEQRLPLEGSIEGPKIALGKEGFIQTPAPSWLDVAPKGINSSLLTVEKLLWSLR